MTGARPRRVTLWLSLLGAALAWRCSTDGSATGSGGAGTGATTAEGGTAGAGGPAGAGGEGQGGTGGEEVVCVDQPAPSYVPEGWAEWTDWSCDCRLYLPGPDVEIPPLTWEPCPDVTSLGCEWIQPDETLSAQTPILATGYDVARDESILLALTKNSSDHFAKLVVTGQGEVVHALLTPRAGISSGCLATDGLVNDGRWILSMSGNDIYGNAISSPHDGAIGGWLDESEPEVLAHYVDNHNYGFRISDQWITRLDTSLSLFALPWDLSTQTYITSPFSDPEGLQTVQVQVHGEAVFWTSTKVTRDGINVWTPQGGMKSFVRWIGDPTRGARNLGTDGVDMVWSYGEGKAPSEAAYPVKEVWTAPFTTDPAQLDARRVRSQLGLQQSLGSEAWVVGCGLAARPAGGSDIVQIVRLSDGWTWLIPNDDPGKLVVGHTLGITCDELYGYGAVNGRWNVLRIDLSSLGPGFPGD